MIVQNDIEKIRKDSRGRLISAVNIFGPSSAFSVKANQRIIFSVYPSIQSHRSTILNLMLGTHVRFRLGGYSFPPGIYFKLYTHRPLCDINSFAPRDYSKEKKSDGGFRNSAVGNGASAVKRSGTGMNPRRLQCWVWTVFYFITYIPTQENL